MLTDIDILKLIEQEKEEKFKESLDIEQKWLLTKCGIW